MIRPPKTLIRFLETYAEISDIDERSDYLIETAGRFREVSDRIASRPFPEQHRVPACESQAFVFMEPLESGFPKFHFAVENPQGISAKALAVILDETLSGARPEEIAAVPDEIVFDIFGRAITMGRGQGLMSMVRMVKALARPEALRAAAGDGGRRSR